MRKGTDAEFKPRISILGEELRSGTRPRFRVDIDGVKVRFTYAEFIIITMLAVYRERNIDNGWICLSEFGWHTGSVRMSLFRMVKRIRVERNLRRWAVYESDWHGRIRLLTDPHKIKLSVEKLMNFNDYRLMRGLK